jgi:hypothetical protein
MGKVKTNRPGLTGKQFCSCYVPRETPPIQALETQGFHQRRLDQTPAEPPPQPQRCMTQNHHVSIVFSHKNAKNRAISINFCESVSTGN